MSTRDEDFVTQIFIDLDAHAGAVLLLARHVLPHEGLAAAGGDAAVAGQGAGQPAAAGRRARSSPRSCRCLRTTRPGATLELMFATRSGNVRRNSLTDFENINRNGKIAMKLDEGDRIVASRSARPDDDVLLTTAQGQCIRFLIEDDVRLFKGRDSRRRARHPPRRRRRGDLDGDPHSRRRDAGRARRLPEAGRSDAARERAMKTARDEPVAEPEPRRVPRARPI